MSPIHCRHLIHIRETLHVLGPHDPDFLTLLLPLFPAIRKLQRRLLHLQRRRSVQKPHEVLPSAAALDERQPEEDHGVDPTHLELNPRVMG